jgi:hypothetical protein
MERLGMDSDAYLDQEYEKLNDAILQAIVRSKEVQDILEQFKSRGQMNDKSVLNLFLSLDELYQMINEDSPPSIQDYKLEPGKQTNGEKSAPKDKNIVDGKPLTSNEVLFEEHYQGHFSETDWMKKVGVRF